MSTPTESYARAFRQRRRQLHLTQQDLADLAGVSVRSVHEIERGKPTVRLDVLTAVATALGLELALRVRHPSAHGGE